MKRDTNGQKKRELSESASSPIICISLSRNNSKKQTYIKSVGVAV
jgi:hypothetical protein